MARQDKAARYKDMPGNQSPHTPQVKESELAALKMDEPRDRAKGLGVSGTSGMRKEQLVKAVAKASTGGDRLRHVTWDEWFETFDRRGLNFIYQERRGDGTPSNFFRLENPRREDA